MDMEQLCAVVDEQLLRRCTDGTWEHTGACLAPSSVVAPRDRELLAVLDGRELWHAQLPSLHFTRLGPCFATPAGLLLSVPGAWPAARKRRVALAPGAV